MNRQKPISILSQAEIEALQAACSGGATGTRNKALIGLLRGSAVRISEALALKPADVDLRTGLVTVLRGKGGKGRTVGCSPSALATLELWLHVRRERGLSARAPLFCTLKGGPLADAYVRELLPRLARRAGIDKRVHPHGLRHSAAVAMLRAGSNPYEVQQQLGHAHLSTTLGYMAHAIPVNLPGAMAAAEEH